MSCSNIAFKKLADFYRARQPVQPIAAERVIPALLADNQEAHRKLLLDGTSNTRDLGGYETSDGRKIKWGMIYRTDNFSRLSDEDLLFLKRLDIKRVHDFRGNPEVEKEPDRLPDDGSIMYRHTPIQSKGTAVNSYRDKMLNGGINDYDFVEMLTDSNIHFPTHFSSEYSEFMHSLLEKENLPIAFHCTAGKDRAGFAAAIFLLALGVPRDLVKEDYLKTNFYTTEARKRIKKMIRVASFFRTRTDHLDDLIGVREEYIDAAFTSIDTNYGNDENYLDMALGFDKKKREKLRAMFLES